MDLRKTILIWLVLVWCGKEGVSQMKYSGKVEVGYLEFLTNTIQVDPGPNWKGYYLDNENGFARVFDSNKIGAEILGSQNAYNLNS